MNVEKIYAKAKKAYESKKYVAALKILKDLQKISPTYKKGYYLESIIWEERKNYVKSYQVLKKILPLLVTSSPNEKKFASVILSKMGRLCDTLGFIEQSCKFFYQSALLTDDEKIFDYKMASVLLLANCSEYFTDADFHAIYDEYKKILANIVPYPRKFYAHKKIRVGFLSADFKNHPVIMWSWSLITRLDKRFFEVYCYSNVKEPDTVTGLVKLSVSVWRDITALTDAEAAKLIHDDEIDILFDLNGHTKESRLCIAAYHPAFVQICGVGYMNSTGLDCFDYFLSDVYCTEKVITVSDYFNEKVIRLPHTHICYEPTTKLEPALEPPCIKNGYVTFGSFNNFRKVTDSILRTWKKILDAVPNSRLILKHKIFDTDDGKNFIGERLKKIGINPARVEMRGYTAKHLAEYADMDIALDTFPYTGGVTTCEALYMGVPVISLYGDRPGTRFGYSILKNIGLDELAVESYDDYVNRAIALANDWELLSVLRKNLRTMMEKSPVMNWRNYISAVEKTFAVILDAERKSLEQNN